jgi:hypothetical protein
MDELKPNVGEVRSPFEAMQGRSSQTFTVELKQKMIDLFSDIEYEFGRSENFASHILSDNYEDALVDSVPLFSFFSLYRNKAREKEEFYEESLKTLLLRAGKEADQTKMKAGSVKADVRSGALYIKTQKTFLKFKRIARDCEYLAEAMKLRLEAARTRAASNRVEQLPGGLSHY